MGIQYSFRRYEKKYFLSPHQQEQLLQRIAPYIKEDAFGSYTICNIYYDTPDWRLIRASLEKPAYKEKLRVRSYGVPTETDRVFVELKKKFDGVVYKRRITTEVPQVEPLLCGSTEAKCQIGREIQWFQRQNRTRPRVFIGYDRLAFAGQEDPQLRLTFDTNLRWRDTQLDLCMGGLGRTHPAGGGYPHGAEAAGGVPPVADPRTDGGGGFPHVLLQIRDLLQRTYFEKGGAFQCLILSSLRA